MIKNINYIELKNCIASELNIRKDTQNINLTPTKDVWQIDTYLLGKFQSNLEAGNVGLGGLPITDFRIKRRRIDSTRFIELGIIPKGTDDNFYYLDTTPRAGVVYEYEVSPMSNDIEGDTFSVQIGVKFDYWWLSNVDDGESYPFFANLEVSDINMNTQRHIYEGFNEFPTIAYGNQKYQSGTISAILLDSFLETSYNYRDKVEKFINNRKPKYLKSSQGDIWIVDTHSSRRKPFIELAENISSVTFDWTEINKVVE